MKRDADNLSTTIAKGNLTKKTEAVGLPEQRVTTYTYDQYGERLPMTRKGLLAPNDSRPVRSSMTGTANATVTRIE